MESWFPLALLAGLTSAANVYASKLLVTGRLNPILVGGWVHVLGGLICLPGLPLIRLELPSSPLLWLGVLGMGAIYVLGNLWYFSALAQTPLSEIDFYLRTSSLWTFLGGLIILSEPLGWGAVVGAGLILASVFSLSQQNQLGKFSRAQLLALGAALAFGAGNLVDKALSPHFDALSYTLLNQLLTGLGMLAVARAFLPQLRAAQLWGWGAWLVALTFALTQTLLVLAYQADGAAGQVILVAQARLLLLVGIGVLVLGERERLSRKLIAALLMLAGIFTLYQT
ncbi:MAG: DMT family transporter [Meiothermus sp.]|nr:DMT family transporter [Meiothermus sp.]